MQSTAYLTTHKPHAVATHAVTLAIGIFGCRAASQGQVPDYDFQWATIGAIGNAPFTGPTPFGDIPPIGQVNYEYRISKMEVTSAQWMEFANAASVLGAPYQIGVYEIAGFREVGVLPNGMPVYGLRNTPYAALQPVRGINWRDAARYCNWLHNAKAMTLSALESGAYDTSTFYRTEDDNGNITYHDVLTHEPGAKFWIPTQDEWVKAAHYDPNRYGPGQGGYWQYSTTSDTAPIIGPESQGGQTNAGYVTNTDFATLALGSHPATTSPWGLLDTSGGASEWLEFTDDPIRSYRYYDGSHVFGIQGTEPTYLDRIDLNSSEIARFGNLDIGLRIASAVPAPSTTVVLGVLLTHGFFRKRRVL
jgi:formylglycine-generating enzyme required for sulfatase activity